MWNLPRLETSVDGNPVY
uniref:Uncharacterized protein n=1 Tax=Moniliophthora roreri TaxID=221103 RepID=A0A0W0FSN6_MONRR